MVQIVEDSYRAAKVFGNSLLLLDRYFLTVPALETLKFLNGSGDVRMEIILKAKKSCTAFEKPGPRKPGRGRPPKQGAAVHLKGLFVSHAAEFKETEAELYGKKAAIEAAIYMGCKEIYLLGVDCNYSLKNLHFMKTEYDDEKWSPNKNVDVAEIQQMSNIIGYEFIKKEAEKRSVKIYNATRGGSLEVFERVNSDDIDFNG